MKLQINSIPDNIENCREWIDILHYRILEHDGYEDPEKFEDKVKKLTENFSNNQEGCPDRTIGSLLSYTKGQIIAIEYTVVRVLLGALSSPPSNKERPAFN
ncbi:hypothetical protein [Paenibacillus sp. N3.4]|uniref:hypothetical protein n=1 Tax=Paenibacillus sp. N3.4 TaxID=2603222 RepID=UPI0011CBEFFD|nr:hypothetical protein [Paenibacillus sp. N3.4]TXK83966.1 hypothetical protein FU659_10955 [Paenibacillus sp. N3.4]